jgi:hypothetical protein
MAANIGPEEDATLRWEKKKGSEFWFGFVVGLPRAGIDPEKDTSHVSDEEVVNVFGPKFRHFGYKYKEAKVERIKLRIRELYKAIYQAPTFPAEYITESFARAIISEVCHMMPMNWARFAESAWLRKKGDISIHQNAATVVFQPAPNSRTYDEVILQRLKHERTLMETELKRTSENLENARACLRRECEPGLELIEERARRDGEVLNAKLGLEMAQSQKKYAGLFKEMAMASSWNKGAIPKYEEMEAREDCAIKEFQEFLDHENELREKEAKTLADYHEKERTGSVEVDRIQNSVNEKSTIIHRLIHGATHTMILRPSRFISETDSEDQVVNVNLRPCALCNFPFPNRDAILAPCLCFYHPWCATMQNWLSKKCARSSCERLFNEKWQRSMGLYNIEGNLNHSIHKFKENLFNV